MTHAHVIHFLAKLLIVCVVGVFFIDVGSEFENRLATRLKWSMCWIVLRYTAIICGVLLALDVLS